MNFSSFHQMAFNAALKQVAAKLMLPTECVREQATATMFGGHILRWWSLDVNELIVGSIWIGNNVGRIFQVKLLDKLSLFRWWSSCSEKQDRNVIEDGYDVFSYVAKFFKEVTSPANKTTVCN